MERGEPRDLGVTLNVLVTTDQPGDMAMARERVPGGASARVVGSRRVALRDGIELELSDYPGAESGRAHGAELPLLLLHGFTGAADSWSELIPVLGERRRVVAVSLVGHGSSSAPTDPARYAAPRAAADLLELLDMLQLPRVALLGYSMGGRVALHMALAAPDRVKALVLESASPGIVDDEERAARRMADDALADDIEREGVSAFVARWESLPLWESQRQLDEESRARLRAQRLRSNARGLANSLRGLGSGATMPVRHRLDELAGMPVLLLCGALDTRYVTLARDMEVEIPGAELSVVAGAGHAVHLERPGQFARDVTGFLDRVDVTVGPHADDAP